MVVQRKKRKPKKPVPGPGGAREGAGRPSELNNPHRMVVRLEPRHLRALDNYMKKHNLSGRNAAIRHILDAYEF
jgi:hypothetical protein